MGRRLLTQTIAGAPRSFQDRARAPLPRRLAAVLEEGRRGPGQGGALPTPHPHPPLPPPAVAADPPYPASQGHTIFRRGLDRGSVRFAPTTRQEPAPEAEPGALGASRARQEPGRGVARTTKCLRKILVHTQAGTGVLLRPFWKVLVLLLFY